MKKIWLFCLVLLLAGPGLLLAGKKDKGAKPAKEEAAPAVEEAVDMDEIDPLWKEMHALEADYINPNPDKPEPKS